MLLQYTILTILLAAIITNGFPISEKRNEARIPPSKVLDFMKNFGYIEKSDELSEALYTEDGIADTIKLVQKFGAIPQTGLLDNATLNLISSPRCGVPDVIRRNESHRSKRYILGSPGWNKRTITYFIANWSPSLGEATVIKNIQLAFDAWGRYGRLKFQRTSTPQADIIVAFGRGYHGDAFPFDGKGNILAHAFFPYEFNHLGGDIHFDDDENWTDRKQQDPNEYSGGTDFFTVALHELGHSLGLAHSPVPSAVMFPYYRGYDPDNYMNLGYDDILGMYELYIRRNLADDSDLFTTTTEVPKITTTSPPLTTTTTTMRTIETESTTRNYYDNTFSTTFRNRYHDNDLTTSTTTESYYSSNEATSIMTTKTFDSDTETVDDHRNHDPYHNVPSTNSPSLPDICNGFFDAVATLREELFIFKDEYIWRLKEKARISPGYPVPLRQMFPSLPSWVKKIDAAYQRPDGMIVLFTDNQFWVYDGTSFIENSPRILSDYGLPPDLDGIDAIQTWAKNGKTYIYRGDRFWRYNENEKRMDDDYPKHIERWRGIPENIDAATTWKGVTYFFKDELYWKFDNDWVIITEESPLPSPQNWLGCPEDFQQLHRFLSYHP